MKRINNLYPQIYSQDNLQLADINARKGKISRPDVIAFDQNRDALLQKLQIMLVEKTYQVSAYTTMIIREPKERLVYRLPYYPDQIVQHAIMNVLEPIFTACFTADTYSCIKGRGIHGAFRAVRKALSDKNVTAYCLKLDIVKFYPNVNHDILNDLLCRKFKDQDLLWLLSCFIDSADGVPIGNYLSQYFANFYLTQFDHWIKETMGIKYYFRYADDMVVFGGNKPDLHALLAAIKVYLTTNLKLTVKRNYQISPISKRGIDFGGYKHFHKYALLRKSIKKSFARKIARGKNRSASIAAYMGWATHANTKHLLKKLLHEKV